MYQEEQKSWCWQHHGHHCLSADGTVFVVNTDETVNSWSDFPSKHAARKLNMKDFVGVVQWT